MQQTPIRVEKKKLDSLLVAIAVVVFLSGFYLIDSMFLAGKSWYVRLIVVIVSIALSLGALYQTSYKDKIFSLAKGSRIEMQKVHWPTKNESVKTTLMVLAIVAVFAIFLSIVDWLLALIVRGIM